MMKSKKLKATVLAAACALGISACSDSQTESSSPPSDAKPSASAETAAPAPCDGSTTNPLLDTPTLPIASGEGAQELAFQIIDERYDPCTDLSWSVIAGGVGSGNSQREGVVFFHDGKVITEPAPLMQEKVNEVTAVDGESVHVFYDILTGPRAAGQTIPGDAVFKLTPEATLEIAENNLPPEAHEAGIQIDVSQL